MACIECDDSARLFDHGILFGYVCVHPELPPGPTFVTDGVAVPDHCPKKKKEAVQ